MLTTHSGFKMFSCELLTGYLAVQMLFIAYDPILEFYHMLFFFQHTLMVSAFFFFFSVALISGYFLNEASASTERL